MKGLECKLANVIGEIEAAKVTSRLIQSLKAGPGEYHEMKEKRKKKYAQLYKWMENNNIKPADFAMSVIIMKSRNGFWNLEREFLENMQLEGEELAKYIGYVMKIQDKLFRAMHAREIIYAANNLDSANINLNRLFYTQKPFIEDREIGVYNTMKDLNNIFWQRQNFDHTRAVKWLYRNSPDKDEFWDAFRQFELHDSCENLAFLRGRALKELKDVDSVYWLIPRDIIEAGLLRLEDYVCEAQKRLKELRDMKIDEDTIEDDYWYIKDLAYSSIDELRERIGQPPETDDED